MSDPQAAHRRLLEAISFVCRAHQGQLRKDGRTPYASHPFRVCLIVRQLFGIDDADVLTAAVLHDAIEDTTTDFDDLVERFGPEVAGWVALLSKDKRLMEFEREQAYKAALATAPWQVKACKLGDIYDNLLDSEELPAPKRQRTCHRSRDYLSVLEDPSIPAEVRRAFALVKGLLAEVERA
jgi:guanosine-3',5'-bis(diphosphate) 3'-pyrophosphohydrolase